MRSKAALYVAGGVLLLGGLGLGGWKLWTGRAADPAADPVTVAQYVASDGFQSKPREEKQKYVEKVLESHAGDSAAQKYQQMRQVMGLLSDEQQAKLIATFATSMFQPRIDAYFGAVRRGRSGRRTWTGRSTRARNAARSGKSSGRKPAKSRPTRPAPRAASSATRPSS